MAVRSLLMAIRSLRMCIQRLQTEILPSMVKTFTKQLEGMMKGRGKGASWLLPAPLTALPQA